MPISPSKSIHEFTLALFQGNPLSPDCSACRLGPFSNAGFQKATLPHHKDDTTGYTYITTLAQITQSITQESCNWCRIVKRTVDAVPTERFPRTNEEVEVRVQVTTDYMGWTGVVIYLNGEKEATYRMALCDKEDDSIPDDLKSEIFQQKYYVDYENALECIQKCRDHDNCPSIEETYLPTRVIDCTDPTKPRLVETHRRLRGHYCALSYVWGGEQHQKTTTINIETYVREGIIVPLPKTIADAILVTHKLGIRYLWIDALCIIQDSSEDKDNELGIMAHIYGDAYLTLSALSAFRADQGFLPDERAPDVLPFLFPDEMQSPGRMLLRYIMPRKFIVIQKAIEYRPELGVKQLNGAVMHSPLDKRAWCLQENTLSPRRLIFQPPSVFYKCRSFARVDISNQQGLGALSYRGRVGLSMEMQNPSPANDYVLFPINKSPREAELHHQWQNILAVPSDKLVALASITEVLQTLLQDEYVAGLWRRTLLDDLLWEVRPPMGADVRYLPRPAHYRAPSWSWAAVDGDLKWARPDPPSSAACYEAEVLECHATPKVRTYPFGEIVDARLVLRAKVRPHMRDGGRCRFVQHPGTSSGGRLSMVRGSSGWSWTPPPGNCFEPVGSIVSGSEGEEEEKEKDHPSAKGAKGLNVKLKEEKGVAGMVFDCIEGTEQDRETEFYVLALRSGRKWNQGDWIQGLLLVKADGGEGEEQFRRVAKLNMQYNLQWPDWFDDTPLETVTLV